MHLAAGQDFPIYAPIVENSFLIGRLAGASGIVPGNRDLLERRHECPEAKLEPGCFLGTGA
jgi:hypothetical protein